MITESLTRRTFLQSAGGLVAMPAFASLGTRGKAQSPSKKLVVYYQPNGVIRKAFFPGEEDRPGLGFSSVVGAEKKKEELRVKSKTGVFPFELSPTLQPLAPFSDNVSLVTGLDRTCLLYTSPSPRDRSLSRMPSSA